MEIIEKICKALVQHLAPTNYSLKTFIRGITTLVLEVNFWGTKWEELLLPLQGRQNQGWTLKLENKEGGAHGEEKRGTEVIAGLNRLTMGTPRPAGNKMHAGILAEHLMALSRFPGTPLHGHA